MRGQVEYDFFAMHPFGRFGCGPFGGPDFGPGFDRRCGPPPPPPGYGPYDHWAPRDHGRRRCEDSGDEQGRRCHGGPHDRRKGPHHESGSGDERGPPPPFCHGPYPPPSHGNEGPRHHRGGHGHCHSFRPPHFGRFGPGGPEHRGPPPCHGCPSSFGPHGPGPRFFGPWCRPTPYGRPERCCRDDNSDSEEERSGRRGRPGKCGGQSGSCGKGRGDRCGGNSKDRRGKNKERGSGEENDETILVQRIVVEAPRCRSV